jgi:aerobic carbon-monoxide dehydrogenase small subunit
MPTIHFTLNGEKVATEFATHQTIIEILRDRFDLFGARESCAQGLCGCCTVLVDGTAVSGCLYLAAFVDGKTVTTIEHLAADGKLSPLQEAFLETGATQCGFCTPGFVLATTALLARNPRPSRDEILADLSGHVCRCTGYVKIVAAVEAAAGGEVSAAALQAGAAGPVPAEPELIVTGGSA